MSKFIADAVSDAALAKIATCVTLSFCSSAPANKAGIAAVLLAAVTLTAGSGNGDYTIGDGTTGRKLTVAAQTGIDISASGNVTYACLDDGTTLLWGETITTKAVVDTETWESPAFDITYPDPT